ncbi:MAG: acetyl-CoA carboxylase carboxyltransferase subunit alpha [Eubacterium sp.]|nr:acetyl-CoA carboxylase carboxyltransferase subunit alpha [Eubacterium sp.]
MIREIDERMMAIEDELRSDAASSIPEGKKEVLEKEYSELAEKCVNLTAHDKVYLARHRRRPKVDDYINALFTDLFIQRGDLLGKEDQSIFGGIAKFHGIPVTVLGHRKGRNIQESMQFNFGMPEPEGYRKALRMMKQAEKFNRPIITFIDTPGAYPGLEAEEHGQSNAIAANLAEMSALKVPVIAIVTGEGSSGGALAIGVANKVLMLENAVYSVLSPEGFASILWKDATKAPEACDLMKLTAADLYRFGVIDEIIEEPLGGAHHNPDRVYKEIELAIIKEFNRVKHLSGNEIAKQRYEKFRDIDSLVREGKLR